MSQRHLLIALPLLPLLGACASSGGQYPTLAQRDLERMGDTLNVPQTQPHLATAPAALALENAERIGRAAQLAHEGFLDAAQSTRRRVDAAHGASIQSEAWALAQVALAQLQTHRSATLSALADLDRIYIEAANQGQSLEQISASREEVAALLAQEDQAIGDMLENLAR